MRRGRAIWRLLPAALAASAASAGARLNDRSADAGGVCLWRPAQQWALLSEPEARCDASGVSALPDVGGAGARDARPAAPAAGNQSDPTRWSGPNLCVGEYCVWANQLFGGGMVVVTTDDNAKQIAKLSPADPGSTSGASSDAFTAQAIPGKGVGLVAKRPIRRGELIMAESPALVVHKQVLEDRTGLYMRTLELAVPKLPARRRRAFMKQGMQGAGVGGQKIADILFTNSFQTGVLGGGAQNAAGFHYSNFPNVSRLNHDCRPNLVFHIDGNLTHRTRAVRDIEAGEELSISYGDQLAPAAERQARMRSSWGFSCTCAHCTQSSSEAKRSADRLHAIADAERELGDITSPRASVKMIEELLKMYEGERLESKISGAYTLAALNYNLFGKDKLARKYALLAAETVEWEFGAGSGDVQAMRDLAADPRGHFSWRQRLKR